MAALAAGAARDPDRLVIYDCPPLLATDDALIALGYADGCLLVLREGRTTRAELIRAAELVGEERFLGTVLNDAAGPSPPATRRMSTMATPDLRRPGGPPPRLRRETG